MRKISLRFLRWLSLRESEFLKNRGLIEELKMIKEKLELNEKTKREVEEAKKEIKSGKFITHEEIKKQLGL